MMIATSKVVENVLVTCVPLDEDTVRRLQELYGIKVHYLHWRKEQNVMDVLPFLFSAEKAVRSLHADVVHVHGAWDWRAAMMEKLARRHNIVTVVSLHRGLTPELIGIDFWKEKLPKLMAYQIWMVRNCTSAIADSDSELEVLKSLLHKKRVEILPSSADAAEAEELLKRMLIATYRKCLDTVYGNRLTKKERNVVKAAVRAQYADEDVETPFPDVEGVSYRRIFFYAYDEDVMQTFLDGSEKLGIILPPPLNMAETPRYRNPKAKTRGALSELNVAVKTLRIPEEKSAEREAVTLICKAKQTGMHRMTLRHYVELYQLFRYTDFDEDVVMEELKRLHAAKFTKKLQKRLADMFGLKHGYSITAE